MKPLAKSLAEADAGLGVPLEEVVDRLTAIYGLVQKRPHEDTL